ncbi:hypothetical protein K1719_038190 [Acacia pycnantha]|nr:hypothetical protein K1719_038190 [Acacia pycnantha]
MQKLNRGSSSAVPNIVGIDENSNHIESLLKKFSIIGIWGMGGIGKTTMAKVVFAKFHSQFDSCCFIKNLGEEFEKYGLKYICDKLLFELSKVKTLGRFYHKKVFIVLDGVSNTNQLDELQKVAPSLGPGSKVIIISRDRHVLNGRVDKIHKATALSYYSSLQLFNLKAFRKQDCEGEYKELVDKAIDYAKGNPLALTTLGSFLYSKTVKEWESALRKLETTANKDIQGVLRLSYDGLDDEEREIFLDIAFFLKGESMRYIMAVLQRCGFHASICLRNLVDKALISIDYVVHMHDLIQSMAFEIVRQECVKNPGGRSRLHKSDEVYDVLKNNQGSDAIQGLVSFSNPLRHLQLDKFYSMTQPLSFCAIKRVELRVQGIYLTKLGDGVENLVNLLSIDLAGSKQLIELPPSVAQNLEYLDISGCQELRRHLYRYVRLGYDRHNEASIPIMSNHSLYSLRLKNLSINEICCLKSHKQLDIYDCWGIINKSKLHTLFDALLSLESICLNGTSKLTELPNNIKHISRLQSLDVSNCKDLQSLPELPPSTKTVKANDCISLETIPISIARATQLRFLSLQNCLKLEKHSLSRVMEWAYFSLKQSAHKKEKCSVCYPGSKAPEWFTFSQETKASNYVTIELPPSTSDLVGFIFCSVLSHVSYNCYLRCQIYYDVRQFRCFYDMRVTDLDSHQVVLWCAPYEITNCIKQMYDKNTNCMPSVSFEFSIVSWGGDVDGVAEAYGVFPIYSSEYREFLQEKELKLESVTGKKRHQNIDDEQQQPTPTKKWRKSSMLSSKSKTTHDLDELIFSLSQLNLECTKDSIHPIEPVSSQANIVVIFLDAYLNFPAQTNSIERLTSCWLFSLALKIVLTWA